MGRNSFRKRNLIESDQISIVTSFTDSFWSRRAGDVVTQLHINVLYARKNGRCETTWTLDQVSMPGQGGGPKKFLHQPIDVSRNGIPAASRRVLLRVAAFGRVGT